MQESYLKTKPQAENKTPLLLLDKIADAPLKKEPFTYFVAHDVLSEEVMDTLNRDFPEIKKNGFLPLEILPRNGLFGQLMDELEGAELSALMTEKLQVELRDKPKMITIRKWSAAKDGRIHNDGASKIVTALLYLNPSWPANENGGRFAVLGSDKSFDDTVEEIAPTYGTFISFVRSDNSWHGHKPFEGERRVVQTTWLKSWEDLKRKSKRGRFSLLLKNLNPFSGSY